MLQCCAEDGSGCLPSNCGVALASLPSFFPFSSHPLAAHLLAFSSCRRVSESESERAKVRVEIKNIRRLGRHALSSLLCFVAGVVAPSKAVKVNDNGALVPCSLFVFLYCFLPTVPFSIPSSPLLICDSVSFSCVSLTNLLPTHPHPSSPPLQVWGVKGEVKLIYSS